MTDPRPSLDVDLYCSVDNDRLDAFLRLLSYLRDQPILAGVPNLRAVYIVPLAEVTQTVNTIIQENLPGDVAAYDPGHPRKGVAVRIPTDSGVEGVIVLGDTVIQAVDPEQPDDYQTVRLLLEELLHVRLYDLKYQYESDPETPISQDGCAPQVAHIAHLMHDEYIVNRWCVEYLREYFLYGGFGPGDAPTLNQAPYQLAQTLTDGLNGTHSTDATWQRILHYTYRSIFEPLARGAVYYAVLPDLPLHPEGPQVSWFYQSHVAPFWERILAQLERSFDSEIRSAAAALTEIMNVLTEFLRYIGVTYRPYGANECWVDIRGDFFDDLEWNA